MSLNNDHFATLSTETHLTQVIGNLHFNNVKKIHWRFMELYFKEFLTWSNEIF